jgi:hypothetical protein
MCNPVLFARHTPQVIIENAFAYSPTIVAKEQALISAGQDR